MTEGIIGAIIGSAITGIIAFLCEIIKIKHQDKKERAKEQKEIFINRPELKILDYVNNIDNPGASINKKCDIDVFIVPIDDVSIEDGYLDVKYNLDYFEKKNWCCVIYTFKNVGKTDISSIDIMTVFKEKSCLFASDKALYYANNGLLNYSYCYDKKIRENETFTLKICYYKDTIATGLFSATMSIGMIDSFNHYWQQPLFAPSEKIYDSYPVDAKRYYADIKTDDAIECFKNPCLW